MVGGEGEGEIVDVGDVGEEVGEGKGEEELFESWNGVSVCECVSGKIERSKRTEMVMVKEKGTGKGKGKKRRRWRSGVNEKRRSLWKRGWEREAQLATGL